MAELNINRWQMLKKLIVFQVKLAFDAVRDLLLSPVSFICTIIDISTRASEEKSLFNQLMKLGNKTDHWLNLFNSAPKSSKAKSVKKHKLSLPFSSYDDVVPEKNVDQLFDKIEAIIREQHKSGGVTASAKASIDYYLSKINLKSQVASSVDSTQTDVQVSKKIDKI